MIDYELRIENVWLKKVWEISSPSEPNHIKIQTKRGQIYNLRPCSWYARNPTYQPFSSRLDFVTALYNTQQNYPQCNAYKTDWLRKVTDKYLENKGNNL